MGPFKNRHGNNKNSDKGHGDFLNSTCDIGDPQGPLYGTEEESRNLALQPFISTKKGKVLDVAEEQPSENMNFYF